MAEPGGQSRQKGGKKMYYEIDEHTAHVAQSINSFREYRPGEATLAYRVDVDVAAEIAEQQKARVPAEFHAKIDALLNSYSRKLAQHMNKKYRIEAMCPSVLTSGAGNFPVRKKEKQNAARARWFKDYKEIQYILDKIRATGTRPVKTAAERDIRLPLEGWKFDAGEVVMNTEADRVQIFYSDKPDEVTRSALKSNGFKWSPRFKAWQRGLTDNGIRAAKLMTKRD